MPLEMFSFVYRENQQGSGIDQSNKKATEGYVKFIGQWLAVQALANRPVEQRLFDANVVLQARLKESSWRTIYYSYLQIELSMAHVREGTDVVHRRVPLQYSWRTTLNLEIIERGCETAMVISPFKPSGLRTNRDIHG